MDRLICDEGMNGLVRGRKTRTTIHCKGGRRAGDLLNRNFIAETPKPCPEHQWRRHGSTGPLPQFCSWHGTSSLSCVHTLGRSCPLASGGPRCAWRPPRSSCAAARRSFSAEHRGFPAGVAPLLSRSLSLRTVSMIFASSWASRAGKSVFQTPGKFVRQPARPASQDSADRLNRMTFGSLLIDEPSNQRRRGVSFLAKKIEAAFRISLASLKSRFSARRCLSTSRSPVVGPSFHRYQSGPGEPSDVMTRRRHPASAPKPCKLGTWMGFGRAGLRPWQRHGSKLRRVFLGMVPVFLKKDSGIKSGTVQHP